MRVNPVIDALGTYPFVRLREARERVEARGVAMIDFGAGEPREETPAFIRQALADAITPMAPYPNAAGVPALREAIAGWTDRRFGVALDPDTQIVPTLGSKELIFSLTQVVGPGKVGVTAPGYPVAERSAALHEREVVHIDLHAERDFLPDLDAVPWDELAVLWLNYPNNPTAATAPVSFYADALERARAHDVVLASDEAYSELYFGGEAPHSALEAGTDGLLVVNTLSKRSSMPGYRSGFVAGDHELIATLKRYRPNTGTVPLEVVQRASIAAWNDEQHVDAVRDRYRAKRDALLPALQRFGLTVAGGDATFFLWMALPDGVASEAFVLDMLEHGIVMAPGSFFGPAGEGYVRVALVPTPEECARGAEVLAGLTPVGG